MNNAATVTGMGSTWTNTNAFMGVGIYGEGSLTISSGGVVNNTASGGSGDIGNEAGGVGTVTVDGKGSQWNNGAWLVVGDGGEGTLTISNGGAVTGTYVLMGDAASSNGNTLTVESGGSVTTSLYVNIGASALSTMNNATVTGTGSVWNNGNGFFSVGAGGQGSLTIAEGGSVISNGSFVLGDSATSSNNVLMIESGGNLTTGQTAGQYVNFGVGDGSTNNAATVTGAGSVWNNGSSFFGIGLGGQGSLTIGSGGSVTSTGGFVLGDGATSSNDVLMIESGGKLTTGGFVNLGYPAGSVNNNATVTGLGSLWTNTSGFMGVGIYGAGSLTISGGGVVNNTGAGGSAILANEMGSSGIVTVTGSGSQWNNSSSLSVGYAAGGRLTISAGGLVTNTTGDLAQNAGSTGTVFVNGNGSQWNNSSSLTVGDAGIGNLLIQGGGMVTDTTGTIGLNEGSTGFVTISSTSSIWNNTGTLTIGSSGNGTLILQGGEASGAQVTIGKLGTLEGSGTLIGTSFNNNGTILADTSGTLTISTCPTCSTSSAGIITISGGATLSLPSSSLTVTSGPVLIATGGTLTISGVNDNYTQNGGKTTIDGTLNVMDGSIKFSKGSVFGNRGVLNGPVTLATQLNIGDATKAPGKLSITGSYTQKSGGSLFVDVGGTNAGSQFDQLNVTGAASLNGILNLDLIDNFVPTIGETFDILNFGSRTGTFSTVNGEDINSSEHFSVVYNATNVTLDVVKGAAPLGSTGSPNATPEPASLLLLGTGLAGVAGYLRHRRK
jgi:T5SS/PEP-CTERM-associated repeat protein